MPSRKLPGWRQWIWLLLLPLVLATATAVARAPVPAPFSGRVVAVADGDTITVLDPAKKQHRIRLAGIDAPEKAQAFGQVAKKHLSDLVFGKTVTIAARTIDRYGRTVGKVVVDGRDACLEQIRAGLAWHYKRYQRDQPAAERATYVEAEVEARRAGGRRLWHLAMPLLHHPDRAVWAVNSLVAT